MKKDDLIKSIDNINPDAYMGSRLKAKIAADSTQIPKTKRIAIRITAVYLVAALIFGAGLFSRITAPNFENEKQITANKKSANAFIMVVNAANDESAEMATIGKLILNKEYPYEVNLKIVDVRGLSEKEKTNWLRICLMSFRNAHPKNGQQSKKHWNILWWYDGHWVGCFFASVKRLWASAQ